MILNKPNLKIPKQKHCYRLKNPAVAFVQKLPWSCGRPYEPFLLSAEQWKSLTIDNLIVVNKNIMGDLVDKVKIPS